MQQTSPLTLSRSKIELAKNYEREQYRNLARSEMLYFTKYTKPDFRVNWHHVVMCKKLDDFVNGKIRFLMIFAPPRHTKSELVSRRLPALIHGRYPGDKIMAATYSLSLSNDMTSDVQKIMDTTEYVELFPNSRIIAPGSRHPVARRKSSEHDILNSEGVMTGGKYRGQGIGGAFAGKGANWLLIDDPIKGREIADSEVFRQKLWDFYLDDLRTRLAKNGSILITLTRWHEDDLPGRIIKRMKNDPKFDQFETIVLPAIKENDDSPYDIREIGEPLWPDEYDLKALSAIRAGGARGFNSLYQQRPAPLEGNVIKRHWWKYYKAIPSDFDRIVQSWDLTFKGSTKSDYTVGGVWGKKGADKYLLDVFRSQVGFNDQIKAITSLSAKWPDAMAKYVEDAANAAALIETLKSKIPGLIAVPPKGSKEARAESISPQAESGNIWLPDPEYLPVPWVHDFVEEWASFPNGANDDQVDMTSLGVSKLTEGGVEDWSPQSFKKTSTWKK